MINAKQWMDQNDPSWGDLPGKPELTEAVILEVQRDALQAASMAAIAEPELPGDMPDEMWESIKGDRDAIAEALRIAVRQTKSGIVRRIELLKPPLV